MINKVDRLNEQILSVDNDHKEANNKLVSVECDLRELRDANNIELKTVKESLTALSVETKVFTT